MGFRSLWVLGFLFCDTNDFHYDIAFVTWASSIAVVIVFVTYPFLFAFTVQVGFGLHHAGCFMYCVVCYSLLFFPLLLIAILDVYK